jgi:hypothetical protein
MLRMNRTSDIKRWPNAGLSWDPRIHLTSLALYLMMVPTLKRLGVGPKVAGIYVKCQKMHHQSAGKRFFYGAQA